jgi:predicted aminopeptidase
VICYLTPSLRHRVTSSPGPSLAGYRSRLLAAAFSLLLGGCTNLGYYLQSISGQLDIWQRERAIREVIDDPATPPALRQKLQHVIAIREFANRELGLPENESYQRYADLERQYVVWNVVATPEFSLQPVQWCFPFVGCVSYRGYFEKTDAERSAAELAAQGHDVYLHGVPAYSTLGWFADPVFNTFIHFPDTGIARLIFHELAHQVLYVRDDTMFNESFAVAVEQEGVRRWLARTGDARARSEYDRRQRFHGDFVRIVQNCRDRLDALYGTELSDSAKREQKAAILSELYGDYRTARQAWGGFSGYDHWFAQKPNNAQIVSVGIYNELVPAFEALLRREGGDLPRFYMAVKELAKLPKTERTAALHALAPEKAVNRE